MRLAFVRLGSFLISVNVATFIPSAYRDLLSDSTSRSARGRDRPYVSPYRDSVVQSDDVRPPRRSRDGRSTESSLRMGQAINLKTQIKVQAIALSRKAELVASSPTSPQATPARASSAISGVADFCFWPIATYCAAARIWSLQGQSGRKLHRITPPGLWDALL